MTRNLTRSTRCVRPAFHCHHAQSNAVAPQAQSKNKASKSNNSKLLSAQSALSSAGSSLTNSLPGLLSVGESLERSHGSFLKQALARFGTMSADLGKERIDIGERLLAVLFAVDQDAEMQGWAAREAVKAGGHQPAGRGGAGAPTRNGRQRDGPSSAQEQEDADLQRALEESRREAESGGPTSFQQQQQQPSASSELELPGQEQTPALSTNDNGPLPAESPALLMTTNAANDDELVPAVPHQETAAGAPPAQPTLMDEPVAEPEATPPSSSTREFRTSCLAASITGHWLILCGDG